MLLGAVVNVLLAVRHTRTEEQAGRRELLGAGVLGRRAPLAAALAVVAGGDLAVALLAAAGMAASGQPLSGSTLGLTLAAGGLLFAAVGAVAAQLAEGTRTAVGTALGVLGAFFAVAAVGEVARSGLVWASPFGWSRRVQPFAGDRWGVLALFLAVTTVPVAAAFALSVRRDLGAGLVPARPGPATAAPAPGSPLALAWRLDRGAILSWTAEAGLLGLLPGAAMGSIGGQLDTPAFRELTGTLGGGGPADVFFRFLLYVLAQIVAAFGTGAVLGLRGEESDGPADLVLGASVSRARWALGHLAVASAGVVTGLAALGLGTGIGSGPPFAEIGTTLAYLPARLVFAGLAAALFGWAPRLAAPVAWTVLGLVVLIDLIGGFRLVGEAVLGLSPFVRTLVPLTIGDGLAVPLVALGLIAVALGAAGLAGLARRDLG